MAENIIKSVEQVVLSPKPETTPGAVLELAPEASVENLSNLAGANKEGVVSREKTEAATPVSTAPAITDDYHVRREKEIDDFLSDGLGETFLAMTPEKQKIFKEEGEKTAKKINVLLDATKINLGKIVDLIRRWLKLITGVNRFFLDQEAKLKADRIIKIKNKA
jgi:hypothetical protein